MNELNGNTKQSEQPSNAERTATEQVETAAREIVHEAVQIQRSAATLTIRSKAQPIRERSAVTAARTASLSPARLDLPL